jgi:hypothetical protein
MEPQPPEKSFPDSSDVTPSTWADFIFEPGITFDEALTRWEAFIIRTGTEELSDEDCPLQHNFPDGLYTRELFMPAGSVITSLVHRFDNPFFILKGKVTVLSENEGRVTYIGPCYGITKPGTRRLLLVHEDTIWVTVHPNPENIKDAPELVNRLTYMKENPYLEEKTTCQ